LENAKESTSTPYWIRHNVEFVYLVMGYLLAPIVFAYAYVGLACYSSDTTNVEFLAYDTTRPCDWSAEYVFSLSLVSVSILMMYMVFRLLQKHCLRLRVTQHDDANGDTGNPEQHARRGSDKCAAVLEDRAYIQVAFLVKGYKYKFWYWEVTVMVRKALVLSIQVAQPASLNRPLRPMMLLFIVVAALCMQLAAMPTTDSAINKLETCSLAVNAASLLLATYVSQEAMIDHHGWGATFATISALILNLAMLGYFGMFVLEYLCKLFKTKWNKKDTCIEREPTQKRPTGGVDKVAVEMVEASHHENPLATDRAEEREVAIIEL